MIDAPSPNYDDRSLPVSMLVLHYTGMRTGAEALERLRNPAAKVSAHYLLEEDGRIFSLVKENKRAWHAGLGHWRGITDINSASIGIELVNGGHDFDLPAYPEAQIDTLIALCRDIIKRHEIDAYNIVGHSDIAPDRKQDPGEHFPWLSLANAGIGLWPEVTNGEEMSASGFWHDLGQTGYLVPENAEARQNLTAAFQRRFLPHAITGKADPQTCATAQALARLIRTP